MAAQIGITPTSFSTSTVSTITIASHGQPSRKHPSGPLLRHFLQPMHRIGSIWIRPNGVQSSSGTQNMQSSTGQYSTQAGEPAQPVQHSVMTANSFGFFFRGVKRPLDLGSNLNSSGTIPAGFALADSADMQLSISYTIGIFIYAKDKLKPLALKESRGLATQTGISFWPDCGLFRGLFTLHAVTGLVVLDILVFENGRMGSGNHCWRETAELRHTMSDYKRGILEALKLELAFLEQGGYGRSVRTPQTPTRSFQDSLTCLNFGEPPHPCNECCLADFVPRTPKVKTYRVTIFR